MVRFEKEAPTVFQVIQKLLLAVVVVTAFGASVEACPFCSAVSQTLTEQIEGVDVAVLAELIDLPPKLEDGPETPIFEEAIEASKGTFRIEKIFSGEDELGDIKEIRALYLSEKQPGEKFLIMGRKQPEIEWGAPIWLSERAQEYLGKVVQLPSGKENAHERLAFFEDYLQDEESLLRADAFDEFARADYDVLKKIKDRLNRPRLLEWIKNPEVTRSHRRLYFTMLGVCGSDEDAKLLEAMLRSGEESDWQALDALVACYLTLSGEQGLPLVEELFLKKADLEYVPLFAVTMALRFHGEQADVIPRERIVQAMRHVLDRQDLADLVISDLARWKDWESMDRLAKLFHDVDEDTFFIRMAVVKYMRVCPLPGAKEHMAEFNRVDPKVVKRATMAWPGLKPVPSKPVPAESEQEPATSDSSAVGEEPTAVDAEVVDAGDSEAEQKVKVLLAELQGDALGVDDSDESNEAAASTDDLAATGAAERNEAERDNSEVENDDFAAVVATEAEPPVGNDPSAPEQASAAPAASESAPSAAKNGPVRLTILATALGCATLLLFAYSLILRGRHEPIS